MLQRTRDQSPKLFSIGSNPDCSAYQGSTFAGHFIVNFDCCKLSNIKNKRFQRRSTETAQQHHSTSTKPHFRETRLCLVDLDCELVCSLVVQIVHSLFLIVCEHLENLSLLYQYKLPPSKCPLLQEDPLVVHEPLVPLLHLCWLFVKPSSNIPLQKLFKHYQKTLLPAPTTSEKLLPSSSPVFSKAP